MERVNLDTARRYTVWRFESPTTGEVRIVARIAELDDVRYAHAYQRILWQGWANGKEDALDRAGATVTRP